MKKADKNAKLKFIAKLDGEIVGHVMSRIPYTHAVIARRNEQAERAYAYRAEPLDVERGMYSAYEQDAAGRVGELSSYGIRKRGRAGPFDRLSHRDIEYAKLQITGGFAAWFECHRRERIADFVAALRDGAFNLRVIRWLRSEQAAAARPNPDQTQYAPYYSFWKVVPAESEDMTSLSEVFSQLPAATQRALLFHAADQLLATKSWNQIVALLVGYLGPSEAKKAIRATSSTSDA